MPKSNPPKAKKQPQDPKRKGKKPVYEAPKLEKFGKLEKLIVSGE